MSTTGLAAQAMGANDTAQAADILTRSLIVGLVLSLLVLLLQKPLKTFLLWYTNVSSTNAAGEDTELASLVHVYFRTRVYGAPAVLSNYAINGWLLGVKRSDLTLALQLLLNSTNIVLNLLFVVGFDWGVTGVAIATAVANWIGCVFGLVLCRHCLNAPSQDANQKAYRKSDTHSLQHYGRLFHMNANIFIRSSCLTLCWLTFTQQGVKQGHSVVAANAILLVLQGFTSYALDGFANASEALVGGAIGEQSSQKLHSAIMTSTVQAFIVSLLFTATFAIFGPSLTLVLTSDSEVQEVLQRYWLWIIFLPPVAVWSYQLDGVFIGASRTVEMRNGLVMSAGIFLMVVYGVPRLIERQEFDANDTLWSGMYILMFMRALTLYSYIGRIYGAISNVEPNGEGEKGPLIAKSDAGASGSYGSVDNKHES